MLQLKDKTSVRHVNSFFIEIILVVFFFSIACAILIQVYAKAFEQNLEAEKINSATLKGQSISEVFSSSGDVKKTLTTVFGDKKYTSTLDDTFKLNFDKDWNLSTNNIYYCVIIKTTTNSTSSGKLSIANIEILNKSEPLFSITSSSYLPLEEGDYE